MIIILWIFLDKGDYFDFIHSFGCFYPTLYIIRLLGWGYHFSLLICYPSCQFGDLRLDLTRLLWQNLWYVIGKLSWLKQTWRFCRKTIHVSCKVTFFAILGISCYKNRSDLGFPLGILVSYVLFRQYDTICWKFDLISGFFVFSLLIVLAGWNQ